MSNRSFLCRMDRFILKFLFILQAYLASSVSLLKLGFQFKERIIVPITGDYLF